MANSTQRDPALPPDVTTTLAELTAAMRAAAEDNLFALVLYGGLARGRYVPGSSDINLVVVVRDASAAAIERFAPTLHAAWRSMRVEPFIITPGDIPRLAVTFPTKMLDIQRRHVVLHGDEPFAALHVARIDVRRRIEQELRNLALRLRRRFVAIHDDSAALAAAADDAAAPLAVNLRALLLDRGVVTGDFDPTLAIYDRAATTFGLDREALASLKQIHQMREAATMTREMFGRLLATVDRAATVAATEG